MWQYAHAVYRHHMYNHEFLGVNFSIENSYERWPGGVAEAWVPTVDKG